MATLRARGYGGEAGTANSKFRTIVEIYSEDNGSNGHNIWVQRYIQVTRGNFRGTVIATSWGGSVSVRGEGNYAVSGLVYVGVLGYGGSNTQSGHSQYIASNITRRSDASTSWTAPRPTHTVYYNANGGTGAPSSQTKTYGYILTLSDTVPKREGYIFLGWSKSASATNPTYYAGGQFGEDANVTLYAVWYRITYNVTFSVTGADAVIYDGKEYTDSYERIVGYKERIDATGEMPTARKKNYKFIGWNTRYDGNGIIVTGGSIVEQDTVLYAMFKLQSNCYVRRNGVYEPAMMYRRENGEYKLGTSSVRDKGIYKDSVM